MSTCILWVYSSAMRSTGTFACWSVPTRLEPRDPPWLERSVVQRAPRATCHVHAVHYIHNATINGCFLLAPRPCAPASGRQAAACCCRPWAIWSSWAGQGGCCTTACTRQRPYRCRTRGASPSCRPPSRMCSPRRLTSLSKWSVQVLFPGAVCPSDRDAAHCKPALPAFRTVA